MDDVDTVTSGYGVFPTDAQISGGGQVYKASGTNRHWALCSDGRIVYFFCDPMNSAVWISGFVFGDIDSYVASDAFGCVLIAANATMTSCALYGFNSDNSSYLARAYTQLGTSITSARYSHGKTQSGLGQGGQAYPARADNSLHLWPVECWDGMTLARGMMPGLWNPVHAGDTPHGLIVDSIPNLPGRTLKIQNTGQTLNECAIDLTGPWR